MNDELMNDGVSPDETMLQQTSPVYKFPRFSDQEIIHILATGMQSDRDHRVSCHVAVASYRVMSIIKPPRTESRPGQL